jgi:hypothetical protein
MNHRDLISSYSPIGDDEHGHYSAKPEYYGMLAFSLGGKGRLVKVEMDAAAPGVKAYAALTVSGMPGSRAVYRCEVGHYAGRSGSHAGADMEGWEGGDSPRAPRRLSWWGRRFRPMPLKQASCGAAVERPFRLPRRRPCRRSSGNAGRNTGMPGETPAPR